MKSKLLKVLITTLCVLGILFVIVAVPFILGVITTSLLGINAQPTDCIIVWVIGAAVCVLLTFVVILFVQIYEGIN